MPRDKNRYRRSLSRSSESSYERKKSKSKHKRRSRSKNRSESASHKKKRSVSKSRHKRRSSRSVSRDKYDSKVKRSSPRSKRSRQSRSRSSSQSRYKQRSNKKSERKSRSSSRSDSYEIEQKTSSRRINLDDTETKLEKAIKAAAAAGLTMTKIPTYEYKEVEIKEEMPTIHDRNLLEEINSDSFVQKSFTSTKSKKQSQNIVIDLNTETVKVPEAEIKAPKDDSIINFDEIPCEEDLKEMWIKKLYNYRKKMLRGEI